MKTRTPAPSGTMVWSTLNYLLVAPSVLGAFFIVNLNKSFWTLLPKVFSEGLFWAYLLAGPVCVFLCPALMFLKEVTPTSGGRRARFFARNIIGFLAGLPSLFLWLNMHDLFGASC